MMYIKTCLFFPFNLLIFSTPVKSFSIAFFFFSRSEAISDTLGVEVSLRSKSGACLALKRQKTRSCVALYHSKVSTTYKAQSSFISCNLFPLFSPILVMPGNSVNFGRI